MWQECACHFFLCVTYSFVIFSISLHLLPSHVLQYTTALLASLAKQNFISNKEETFALHLCQSLKTEVFSLHFVINHFFSYNERKQKPP